MNAAEAYRHCEALTRRSAANFYYGIRLLPPQRRKAMCAVYAFARRVDDIGDGPLAREEKLRALGAQGQALARLPRATHARDGLPDGADADPVMIALPDGADADPVMIALADAYDRFQVPPDALEALIEGVRMDVEGVAYETFDDLVLYCRRVAGAIGRACLAIFALREQNAGGRERAGRLADDLGVALQLTNILRDVREDAESGRMYLPAQDLRRFGVIAAGEERDAPALVAALARAGGARPGGEGPQSRTQAPARTRDPAAGDGELGWLCALVRFEADRARAWLQRGIALTSLLDRRSAACVLAMANIYGRLLGRIEADPRRALSERMALGRSEKAWVAARGLLGGFGEAAG